MVIQAMMCCDSVRHNPETDAFNHANDCLSSRRISVATGAADEREATTLTKIKLN